MTLQDEAHRLWWSLKTRAFDADLRHDLRAASRYRRAANKAWRRFLRRAKGNPKAYDRIISRCNRAL